MLDTKPETANNTQRRPDADRVGFFELVRNPVSMYCRHHMCGIVGIFSYGAGSADPNERELLAIRDAMTARGPDGCGMWRAPSGRVLLGHRRLAIIDVTDASAQPMETPDGSTVITFNGEIYNYRALRSELQADGVAFRTTGDTEVLLHLYRRYGEAMVDKLEGMFAFGIWDARAGKLFLARDPHGIKPLYYADQGGVVRFASSVKALMKGGAISRDPDPAAIVGFLGWGSVPEPRTIFRAIQALPAGSFAWIDDRGMHGPQRYWSLSRVYARDGDSGKVPSRAEINAIARDELRKSVQKHLVADVPVGLFLSAGYDSCAILALAAELHDAPIRSVTLQFDEFRGTHDDEAEVAERAARHYGAEHMTVRVGFDEVRAKMSAFLDAMDQPTNDGLNVYWVAHAVHAIGLKAAMTGTGGDELLGGYPSFRRYPLLRQLGPLGRLGWASEVTRRLVGVLATSRRSGKEAALIDALRTPEATYQVVRGVFTPDEARACVSDGVWEEGGADQAMLAPVTASWDPMPEDAWSQIAVAEQSLYMRNQLLRDGDWASMAHSLEVRLPLVDRQLTERLGTNIARQRGKHGKAPLAAAARPGLPDFVTRRAKTGFALPMRGWVLEMMRGGALQMPPKWLMREDPALVASRLENDLAADRVHWAKPWQLLLLGSSFA